MADERLDEIFLNALDVPANELEAFLDRECDGDDRLRRDVLDLLNADAEAGGNEFLKSGFAPKLPAPTPNPLMDELPAEVRASRQDGPRFEIRAEHDQGGLGEVLIAYDHQLGREVAVKQIRPKWQNHDEVRQRFIQEAEVTGRLEHPGVVPVYAMGYWEDGREYYAMRFIEGDTLTDVIDAYHNHDQADRIGKHSLLRSLLNRFVDVCNTIEYAHSKRVLHRDIKPSNIMVGPYGETLVLDWGLAKLLDVDATQGEPATTEPAADTAQGHGSTPTQAGGRIGTPQYMSPEQAAGLVEEIGVHTDVYLLGATLYQILTGQPPHQDESISKLIERIANGDLLAPRKVDRRIPPALEAICLKAMNSNSIDRYASAGQLAADIESWLGDVPVDVHKDSIAVQLSRWIRRHRTAAVSMMVAATILTIGSVAGSLIWDVQRAKQRKLQFEKEQQARLMQQKEDERLLELRTMVGVTTKLAETELAETRYSSALGFLQNASTALREEPSMQQQYRELELRTKRAQQIVGFYEQAEISERYHVMSRDTKAMTAAISALKSLGVWEKDDWWFRLSDQDLSPQQKDDLRWDVYQQLLFLNAMLTKTAGVRLMGKERIGKSTNLIRAARRYIGTDAGKREAAAALVMIDRVESFRLAESARWYRSMADFRFGRAKRLQGSDLGLTENAADAQCLGVLSMIAGIDPSFQFLFRDYQGNDPLKSARDLFQRSANLRPHQYWTNLSLSQVEYLLATRDPNCTWQDLEPAVQTAGRCISIDPDSSFAFADRSTVYREQAKLILRDETMSADERNRRRIERLQWSLEDAQRAAKLGVDQPRLGWQYGLSLFEVGQLDAALVQFESAAINTLSLIDISDAAFLLVDDLRGRNEAAEIVMRLARDERQPTNSRSKFHALLAMIRLSQNRDEDALEQAETSLRINEDSAAAKIVRGMVGLRGKDFTTAAEDFRAAKVTGVDHIWLTYGLAVCDEQAERFSSSLAGYDDGASSAISNDHRAACLMGKARILGRSGEFESATLAIERAREFAPACDLMAVVRPLVMHYRELRTQDPDSDDTQSMKQFLQELSELPRVTNIHFSHGSTLRGRYRAPVLNGDFELGSMRYWSDPSGAAWLNEKTRSEYGGIGSTAEVTNQQSYAGRFSLHIRGQQDVRGSTQQDFPLPAGRQCKVSVWAKTKRLGQSAAKITFNDQEVIEIPRGTQDWQRLEGSFSTQPDKGFGRAHIGIQMEGPGELWLDEIQVHVEPIPPTE